MDLGELEDEREPLSSFLRTTLKVEVTSDGNNVSVDSEKKVPTRTEEIGKQIHLPSTFKQRILGCARRWCR